MNLSALYDPLKVTLKGREQLTLSYANSLYRVISIPFALLVNLSCEQKNNRYSSK